MLMHAGWAHILGNMLFLWIFGNNVEDAMGRVRFLVFYLCAGLAADALQTAVTLHTSGVQGASIPNLGASGAIAGVLGAYFLLLPRARVLTWVVIFPIEIRAFWFLGIWFALQALTGNLQFQHPEAGGGVAAFAHIGGAAFGLLTVYLFAQRRPLQPSY
jgi:membrane associated rhomboid family serine protease